MVRRAKKEALDLPRVQAGDGLYTPSVSRSTSPEQLFSDLVGMLRQIGVMPG